VSSGRSANVQSARGRASFASAGVSRASFTGGGPRGGGAAFAGGGGFRGGGGGFHGGGGRGGGGRRSDIALKHDIVLLGHLDNSLGYYRFSYLGSDKAYVGVIAQEVQAVMPGVVKRGDDGYLRVNYDGLGIKFLTYRDWLATGGQIPTRTRM
jgi:Chaperone of endosialidase